MTHFGISMLQHKPELLARQLTEKTGIQVIAATDGMKIDLKEVLLSTT